MAMTENMQIGNLIILIVIGLLDLASRKAEIDQTGEQNFNMKDGKFVSLLFSKYNHDIDIRNDY